MKRFFAIAVLALVCSLGAARAHAQDEDARTLFQDGTVAYQSARYEDAIAAWERAYALDPRPLLQFNLSQAYERLGRVPDAIAALELFLREAPAGTDGLDRARARLSELQARAARTGIQLRGGPDGATVLVDGEDRGRLPHPEPFSVTPGNHEVIVRDRGGATLLQLTVVVLAGESSEVTVTSTGGGSGLAPLGLGLIVSGAIVGVTGGVLGGVAIATMSGATSPEDPATSTARALALGADITIPVGLVAAGAGIVVLVLDAPQQPSPTEPRAVVLPAVAPGFVGVFAAGCF